MTRHVTPQLIVSLTAAMALVLSLPRLHAQDSGSTFDVASIRKNVSGAVSPFNASVRVAPGGRVIATNLTLRELVRDAYGFQRRSLKLVTGGPRWIDGERYDVNAKAARPFSSASRDGALPAEAVAMLRALLIERFKLEASVETVIQPVYHLVLRDKTGKLGPGLTQADGTCLGPYAPVPAPSLPGEPPVGAAPRCPFFFSANVGAEFGGMTMEEFATFYSVFPVVDRFVIDKTGLTGPWNLKVGPWQSAFQQNAGGQLVPTDAGGSDELLLTGVVRRDLGLALEKAEGSVPRVVIASAERPTDD